MDESRYFPEVIQVVPGDDYEIYVYFSDGSIRLFDAEPLLDMPVFRPLRDRDVFRESLTVMGRTVAWDISGTRNPATCVDLDPIEIYRAATVPEPAWLSEGSQAPLPSPEGQQLTSSE